MLKTQQEKQKFRQQITGRGLGHEVNVYVPLGLVKPKEQPRRGEDFQPSAERGMQQYELTEKEIEQEYRHEEFLQQVIEGKDKNLAIVGEPGAGKSTWLEEIALYVDNPEKGFPICIPLASLAEKTLEEYLFQNWLEDALPFISPDAVEVTPALEKKLKEFFNSGKVWLLLDGVDEMRLRAYESPLQTIANQLRGWVDMARRVVLTCRLNVWEANPNALPNFETYRTLHFDDEQVVQFIRDWFTKAGKPKLGEQLEDKLRESGRKRIRDLIKNPLRLAMSCGIWYFNQGELPKTKAALYQRFRDYFYQWKPHPLLTDDLDKQEELHSALSKLALEAIDKKLPLREKFVHKVMGKSLFKLAREVGWLNWVYKDAETDEDVYAFFHLTFQEYFAALAIGEWQFFLNHVPHNPDHGTYRIFEQRWREVILLWLGRDKKEVPDEQKEEFIQALVEFKDGCGKFYGYRAYFLAAAGIAEFRDCIRADKIVRRVVQWNCGYFDSVKKKIVKFIAPIKAGASTALIETDSTKLTHVLIDLIQNSKDEGILASAVNRLGEIGEGNSRAVPVLVNLIQNNKDKDEFLSYQVALCIGRIGKDNPIAVTALVELIQATKDLETMELLVETLWEVCQNHSLVISILVEFLNHAIDNIDNIFITALACEKLGDWGKNNPIVINALVGLIKRNPDLYVCEYVVYSLAKMAPENPILVPTLINLINNYEDLDSNGRIDQYIEVISHKNPLAIDAIVDLIQNSQDEKKRLRSLRLAALSKVNKIHSIVVKNLIDLIDKSKDKHIRIKASEILGEIDKDNSLVVTTLLSEIIHAYPDTSLVDRIILWILYKISKHNSIIVPLLIKLIQRIQDLKEEWLTFNLAKILLKIEPENSIAIDSLIQLVENSANEIIRLKTAEILIENNKHKQTAITALIKLIKTPQIEDTVSEALWRLGEINEYNKIAINFLEKFIPSCQSQDNRKTAVESLIKIDPGNPTAIAALVDMIQSSQPKSYRFGDPRKPVDILKTILEETQMAGVVTALKDYLSDEAYKNDYTRYVDCYEAIWHCAQTLPYPAFYEAWHNPPLTPHPEVAETTGVGFIPDSQRLNLVEFPSLLHCAINSDSELSDKVQLICIDGSKFIDRDNPATKIYNEMRRQGCPKIEDGKPKTMAQLQDYWDDLRIDCDKRLALVFYENPTGGKAQGFSDIFLDALSRFDGAICVVCDKSDISLQSFFPCQPNLIEDILGWLREREMER
jgi:HEAT repeat protein